jgi:cytochrome c oxidase cbb3-type subunit II
MNDHPAAQVSGHERIETNNLLMIVLILLVVAVGGIVEIVPLFFQRSTTEPAPGLKPLTALQLAGRDIYTREGCYNCHPFQWGSKRTGPDLHRVGGKYSDEWHRLHLNNPRDLVPESNMPSYPWLLTAPVDDATIAAHMTGLRRVGVPYSDQEITQAAESVRGKSEIDALVAYLQVLGTSVK